jgi:hypothetical protein
MVSLATESTQDRRMSIHWTSFDVLAKETVLEQVFCIKSYWCLISTCLEWMRTAKRNKQKHSMPSTVFGVGNSRYRHLQKNKFHQHCLPLCFNSKSYRTTSFIRRNYYVCLYAVQRNPVPYMRGTGIESRLSWVKFHWSSSVTQGEFQNTPRQLPSMSVTLYHHPIIQRCIWYEVKYITKQTSEM